MPLHLEALGLLHLEIGVRALVEGGLDLAVLLMAQPPLDADVAGHIEPDRAAAEDLLESLALDLHRDIDTERTAAAPARGLAQFGKGVALPEVLHPGLPPHLGIALQAQKIGQRDRNFVIIFVKIDIAAGAVDLDLAADAGDLPLQRR